MDDLRKLCFDLPLPERPPYGAYVAYHERVCASDDTRAYWREQLSHLPSVTWPMGSEADRSRALATTRERVATWRGAPSLRERLSRAHAVTPAIFFRVVLALSLARLAGTKEGITLGVVRSGRDVELADCDEMIGACVSVLPSRVALLGTALEAFRKEAQDDLAARLHQHVSLSDVVALAGVATRHELFSTLFTYQSLADRTAPSDGSVWPLTQPPEQIHMPTSYALSVEVTPPRDDDDAYSLACFYDEHAVADELVDGLLHTMEEIADACIENPEVELDALLASGATAATTAARKSQARTASTVDLAAERQYLEALKDVWAATLRLSLDDFGTDDTFTSLGGDSVRPFCPPSSLSRPLKQTCADLDDEALDQARRGRAQDPGVCARVGPDHQGAGEVPRSAAAVQCLTAMPSTSSYSPLYESRHFSWLERCLTLMALLTAWWC